MVWNKTHELFGQRNIYIRTCLWIIFTILVIAEISRDIPPDDIIQNWWNIN